jgi:hypothetical protein
MWNQFYFMHTYTKGFLIHSVHLNVDTMCRTENIESKFKFFPHVTHHASIDCCDDIPDLCIQIFSNCTVGSIKRILNVTTHTLD